MNQKKQVVGRVQEIKKLKEIKQSNKSEFLVVYGRRRVGKTFLIREFFESTFDFTISGLANANTEQQLFNFHHRLAEQSNMVFDAQPMHWLDAFERVRSHIASIDDTRKKVIFIDEMPWFDTAGSDFLIALESFWNGWASARKDIILVACGSAASWIINVLINNSGGLHNRVTQKIKIEPFTLCEVEKFLKVKNCAFERYEIVELYMVMGGIPYYLDGIDRSKSVAQNIDHLCFSKAGLLKNEFLNLYRSLFKRHEVYENIVETLSTKNQGMQRIEIIEKSGIASGGTLTKALLDLEECGFITSHTSLDDKIKNTVYRLSDFFTSFYFKFIEVGKFKGNNVWSSLLDNPAHRAWQGFTFEQVCIDHVLQIKNALGIHGILSNNVSWRGTSGKKSAQIDLLIDRRDQVINLCEIKFSLDTYTITKEYADKLREKIATFREVTATKKSVFLTMITTYGVTQNKYSSMLVQNQIGLNELFVDI